MQTVTLYEDNGGGLHLLHKDWSKQTAALYSGMEHVDPNLFYADALTLFAGDTSNWTIEPEADPDTIDAMIAGHETRRVLHIEYTNTPGRAAARYTGLRKED